VASWNYGGGGGVGSGPMGAIALGAMDAMLPAPVQGVMDAAAVPPTNAIGDGCSTSTKSTILPSLVSYFPLINSIWC
jgi:hypothetical protein